MDSETLSSHVAVWVLLTIVVNTMAQSVTLKGDHTFYLHSSPLYSVVESLWTFVRIAVHACSLDLPFLQTMKISIRTQADTWWDKRSETTITWTEPNEKGSRTWPRWLFFIMGPLPAAIKLGSFQGVPWTQALGMMSLSAFLMNEVLLLCVGAPQSVPPLPYILGYSELDWVAEEKRDLRSQIEKLKGRLQTIELFLRLIFGILHIIFLLYAAMMLWEHFIAFTRLHNNLSQGISLAFEILEAIVNILFLLGWIFTIARACCFPHFISGFLTFPQLLKISGVSIFALNFLPRKIDLNWSFFWKLCYFIDSVGLLSYMSLWCLHRAVSWIARRQPRFGKALMVVKEENEAGHEKVEVGEIVEERWATLCLFLGNLGTCVLWYMFLYDEQGTENPEWTSVFGR